MISINHTWRVVTFKVVACGFITRFMEFVYNDLDVTHLSNLGDTLTHKQTHRAVMRGHPDTYRGYGVVVSFYGVEISIDKPSVFKDTETIVCILDPNNTEDTIANHVPNGSSSVHKYAISPSFAFHQIPEGWHSLVFRDSNAIDEFINIDIPRLMVQIFDSAWADGILPLPKMIDSGDYFMPRG